MSGTKIKPEPGITAASERAEARAKRLGEALRANLKRRKGSVANEESASLDTDPAEERDGNQGKR